MNKILAVAFLFGCAGAHRESKPVISASDYKAKDGTAAASNGNVAPKGKMICTMERTIGSNIVERVCRYQPVPGETRSLEGMTSGAGQQGAPPAAPPAPVAAQPQKPVMRSSG